MAEVIIPELNELINEVRAIRTQMDRIEALLNEKEGKPYLTIQEIAAELKYSEGTIKLWCTKGRRHPLTRKTVLLKAHRSTGGHYRIKRNDLEVFKEIFTTN